MRCCGASHVAMRCPDRALFCGDGSRSGLGCMGSSWQGICRKGLVEGRYVTDILLDTRCSRTLVLQELVPPGMHVKNIA